MAQDLAEEARAGVALDVDAEVDALADIGGVVARIDLDVEAGGPEFVVEPDFGEAGPDPVGEDVVGEDAPSRRVGDGFAGAGGGDFLEAGRDPATAVGVAATIPVGIEKPPAVCADLEGPVARQGAEGNRL